MRRPPNVDLDVLRHVFRQALTAAVTLGPAVVTGCGGAAELQNEPGFVPVACTDGARHWLANVNPATPVDYSELVWAGFAGAATPVDKAGEPCASATDRDLCLSALASLSTDPNASFQDGFRFGPAGQATFFAQLHATRGDDIFSLSTRSSVIDFLGPIDTPAEAMLVGELSGYEIPCDRGGALPTEVGFFVQAFQYVGCDGRDRFILSVTRDGTLTEAMHEVEQQPASNCTVGRRPAGLCRARARSRSQAVAGFWAEAAALEHASVYAFAQLRGELRAHGAPRPLQSGAVAAALDEVRHARTVARLARRFGAKVEAPRVRAGSVRELEAIAIENATEGCVRETFGALVGHWQALHAADPTVRRVYQEIAEDELRHAALAWSVARWVEPLLTEAARDRVAAAKRDAGRALLAELAVDPSADVQRVAGIPNARHAEALARHVLQSLAVV
jgi:hypothetical protein